MFSLLGRALVPLGALAIGTWLGMGKPDADVTFRTFKRGIESVIGAKSQILAEKPPPVEPGSPSIDPGKMAEPVTWPRLNPDASELRAWLLAEGPAYAPGDGRRYITFTFDDGPFPETTPTVLKILEQYKIRATFFFIGRYLQGDDKRAHDSREAARRIAAAGHLIGNHTADHLKLQTIARPRAIAQIDEGAQAIEETLHRAPIFFRPPYGKLDPWLEGAIRDRGLELVLWSVSAQDIERNDADGIFDDLRSRIEYAGGGTVLLHDMHWPSVRALGRLLRWVHEHPWNASKPHLRGYEPVDLIDYIKLTSKSPQPHATRQALEEARRASWGKRAPNVPKVSDL